MPSLAGFFGRKNKPSHQTDSALSSPAADYVTPDRSLPSSPNGKSSLSRDQSSVYPSTSRLKLLPFGRKKPAAAAAASASSTSVVTSYAASQDSNFSAPPRPSYLYASSPRNSTSSAASDNDHDSRRLRPPPSKSAIFAAYGDPNGALSTRSLPNGSTTSPLTITTSSPPLPSPPPVPPKNSKKPGFFQWSRSTPTSPQSSFTGYAPQKQQQQQQQPWQLSPISPTKSDLSDSFNLKSFRHVGGASSGGQQAQAQASSPSPPTNVSNTSLLPPTASASGAAVPRPRPRGMSANSDSSQRISVAAFREAQARRSTAGSPVPSSSGRDPSPGGLYATSASGTANGPRGQVHSSSSAPAVPQKTSNRRNNNTKRSSMLAYDSDSDESESEEDEDVDSGDDDERRRGRGGDNVSRRGTVTKRSFQQDSPTKFTSTGRATKSEIGHGTTTTRTTAVRRDINPKPGPRSLSSHVLMSQYPGPSSGPSSAGVQRNADREQQKPQPRSQSSLGFNSYGGQQRPRASVSTSALTPSGAAKRASVLAAANSGASAGTKSDLAANTKRHSRAISAHNDPTPSAPTSTSSTTTHARRPAETYSDSDSDSSDDDAPLATLVPPRRPGSALSSHTGSHTSLRSAAAAHKPLIDINELTNGRPKPVTVKGSSLNVNVNTMEAFTGGGTLLGRTTAGATGVGGSGSVQTSVDPPTKFVSPPSSPVMEPKQMFQEEEIVRLPLQQQQQQQQRQQPVRRETSPEGGSGSGRKDALGERLARVVQMRSDKGISGGVNTAMATATAASSVKVKTVSVSPSVPATAPGPNQIKTITTTTTTTATSRSTTRSAAAAASADSKHSPISPDEDLASLLGAGVHLIRRNDDSESESDTMPQSRSKSKNAKSRDSDDESGSSSSSSSGSGSESESGSEDGYTKIKKKSGKSKGKGKGEPELMITPIPIKERAPPPAFSVTSRPPLKRLGDIGAGDRTSVVSANVLSQGQTKTTTTTIRQRSATLVPTSSSSLSPVLGMPSIGAGPSSPLSSSSSSSSATAGVTRPGILNTKTTTSSSSSSVSGFAPRQRSSTLLPNSISTPPTIISAAVSTTATSASSSSSSSSSSSANASASKKNNYKAKSIVVPSTVPPPSRPFAAERRESPASSTGDSSSGRAPFTPKDGSEVGVGHSLAGGGGVSGLTVKHKHANRRSVSFGDELGDVKVAVKGRGGKEREKEPGKDVEERRKERRRGEAKAAIELGNVINGRGPVMDDDDDLPINQTLAGGGRMSSVNPMMAMGAGAVMGGGIPMGFGPGMAAASPGWNMNMNMNPAMLSPAQFMPPAAASADPNFMAAHQQAMMYAKQAYQMAVAQQAMAAAGDEWERGSTIGGFGSGGSVYGGPSPSIVGSPFAMSPMMNMGMGMGMQSPGAGWSGGSVIFPASSRSMYGGISGARSEYGGASGRGGQWNSSKSSYGESFGPPSSNNRLSKAGWSRDSGYFPPVPPLPQHASGSPSSKVDSGSPRSRTTSQPANPGRGVRKIAPSSWKASGA